jgi:hypothetical protein
MQRKLAHLEIEEYWDTILGDATRNELVQDLKTVLFRIRTDTEIANKIRKALNKKVHH